MNGAPVQPTAICPFSSAGSIEAVPTTAFPTPARRPLNSRLDCSKLQQAFALVLPDWRTGVDRMLTEVLEPTAGAFHTAPTR